MAVSPTSICNMALSDVGSKTITNITDDTSPEAAKCRLYYEPERDALLRSYDWPFARGRETLSQDPTDPDFEYDNQFILPTDFLAMKSIYENRFSDENLRSYTIEGRRLLTNESTMEIRYIKKITDVSLFDPLFVQLFAKRLALKLTSNAGAAPKIRESLKDDLKQLLPLVAAVTGQQGNTVGTYELETWNDARYSG